LDEILKAANNAADITRQLLAFARKQSVVPKILNLNANVENMLNMLRRLIGEDIDLAWVPGTGLWPILIDPSQLNLILVNLCVNARDAVKGVGKITIETKNTSFDDSYCEDHTGFTPGDFARLAVSDDGCGMDKQILENIFEPFFTTKQRTKAPVSAFQRCMASSNKTTDSSMSTASRGVEPPSAFICRAMKER
jgi:signal transduction histidine kinase